MRKAKRTYRGNEIDHYVTSVTGNLMQAWTDTTPLTCSNPYCQHIIPKDTLFILRTKHWFDVVWKHKNNQPYCRTCVPFYEDREE